MSKDVTEINIRVKKAGQEPGDASAREDLACAQAAAMHAQFDEPESGEEREELAAWRAIQAVAARYVFHPDE